MSKAPNLSEEANGSNKGGKSVHSDTISNPDSDEIFFNKTGPIGFNQSNVLRRQHSPIDLYGANIDIGESPKNQQNTNILPQPFSHKPHSKKSHHKQKYDRGSRRASSENPPTRSEFSKLTYNNQDTDGKDDDDINRL